MSYTQFLYPTNVLGRRNTIDSTSSFSQSRNASHRSLSLARANSNQSSLDTGVCVPTTCHGSFIFSQSFSQYVLTRGCLFSLMSILVKPQFNNVLFILLAWGRSWTSWLKQNTYHIVECPKIVVLGSYACLSVYQKLCCSKYIGYITK